MAKTILILSDGLRYDVAKDNMGFLGHLVESKLASLSSKPNIFQVVKSAGKVTAAAAYYWVSELYNRAPYDRIEDKEVDNEELAIQHGRFYTQDEYPDIELFNSAAHLVRKFSPDYLLLHPMGMDYHGETYGSDSKEYRNHAIQQDAWLAPLIQEWMERDYTVMVTGDHGINKDGAHGGTTPEQREVPLFMIQPNVKGRGDTGEIISQLKIAPTILKLLDAPIPETMKQKPL